MHLHCKIEEKDSQGNMIDVSFDGEFWETERISGVYINHQGKRVGLNGIKCSYYDLIL